MAKQLSFLQELFPCDEHFHGIAHHGPAKYVLQIVFYPNGKKQKGVSCAKEYLCEECLKVLTERRKNNDILDEANDFVIKELRF